MQHGLCYAVFKFCDFSPSFIEHAAISYISYIYYYEYTQGDGIKKNENVWRKIDQTGLVNQHIESDGFRHYIKLQRKGARAFAINKETGLLRVI